MNVRFEQPFEQTDHPSAGDISVQDVLTPLTVDTGDTFDVNVEVSMTGDMGPLSDDLCVHGVTLKTGIAVDLVLTFAGAGDEVSYCHNDTVILGEPVVEEHQFTVTAPEDPGEYDLEISLRGQDTGALLERSFTQITVEGDDPEPDPDPGNGDNGNGGVGLPDPELDLFQRILEFVRGIYDRGLEYVQDLIDRASTREGAAILILAVFVIATIFRAAGELTPVAIAERIFSAITP